MFIHKSFAFRFSTIIQHTGRFRPPSKTQNSNLVQKSCPYQKHRIQSKKSFDCGDFRPPQPSLAEFVLPPPRVGGAKNGPSHTSGAGERQPVANRQSSYPYTPKGLIDIWIGFPSRTAQRCNTKSGQTQTLLWWWLLWGVVVVVIIIKYSIGSSVVLSLSLAHTHSYNPKSFVFDRSID